MIGAVVVALAVALALITWAYILLALNASRGRRRSTIKEI